MRLPDKSSRSRAFFRSYSSNSLKAPENPPTLGACWMVAEGGALPFSVTEPKRGGVGGWGRRGGIPASFPSRSHLRSSRFSRHPRLRQAPTRRPKVLEPGPQAPWRPGPQAPEAWIPPLSPVDFLQTEFLTSCGANPWVRVSKP